MGIAWLPVFSCVKARAHPDRRKSSVFERTPFSASARPRQVTRRLVQLARFVPAIVAGPGSHGQLLGEDEAQEGHCHASDLSPKEFMRSSRVLNRQDLAKELLLEVRIEPLPDAKADADGGEERGTQTRAPAHRPPQDKGIAPPAPGGLRFAPLGKRATPPGRLLPGSHGCFATPEAIVRLQFYGS